MFEQIGLYILILHLLLSIAYILLFMRGSTNLGREYFVLILLVPLFGLITATAIELLIIFKKHGTKSVEMETLELGEDIYWKTLRTFKEEGDLVPLEEAITINDPSTRRKMMLDTLYDDPLKYLDILLIARHNDDIETSHYATTSISQAQRSFQLEIQKMEVDVEDNPNDTELLDKYISVLNRYIESGLLEDYLLRRQRMIYANSLEKKLDLVNNDKDTLIKKLRNAIELNEYASAIDASEQLQQYWPNDEETWIESIRVCVEGQDRDRLEETLDLIKRTPIDWTKHNKNQIAFWTEGSLEQ